MNEMSENLRTRKVSKELKVSAAQINAYLDGRLSSVDKKELELQIGECKSSQELFRVKQAEREFVNELTPMQRMSRTQMTSLELELADVNKAILNSKKNLFTWKKISKLLNKTVFEF